MDNLVKHGLYTVKDQYFSDFPSDHWMQNKGENRPYFFLLKDKDGISWLIPMSKQTENYRWKIKKVEAQRGKGNCIYYHLGLVASIERAFLIGDMFPVDESYIKAPYVIASNHYISRDKKLNAAIYSKAMRYLRLVEQGVMKSRTDILGIKRSLLEKGSS